MGIVFEVVGFMILSLAIIWCIFLTFLLMLVLYSFVRNNILNVQINDIRFVKHRSFNNRRRNNQPIVRRPVRVNVIN